MENIKTLGSREFKKAVSSERKNSSKVRAEVLRRDMEIREKTKQQIKNIIAKENPNFDIDKLLEEISKYNHQLTIFDKGIKLRVNNKIDRVIITVVNNKTNRVILEYPYKEIQKLVEHLKKMTGVLIDKEV